MRAIAQALLVNTNLTHLHDAGPQQTLTVLCLLGNIIGAKGAAAIAQAMEANTTRITLGLGIASETRGQQRSQRPCKSTMSSPRWTLVSMSSPGLDIDVVDASR